MISQETFTKQWLMEINNQLGWHRHETQLKNMEKAVAALHLLECLKASGFDFIFKGGTSLILLLKQIHRLSVDIDLIIETPLDNVDEVFKQTCTNSSIFYRFEKQNRDIDEIFDTDHYKFFYRPFADETEESYILLDLYLLANPYEKTIEIEIVSQILATEGENLTVTVPDIDCILADKLTAFAPMTIGIPLSAEPGKRPKRVEVLKQIFDIGNLFDLCSNIDDIYKTYVTIASHEIDKLKLNISFEEVLDDTLRFALIIGHAGMVEKEQYETLSKGFKDFNKFVADMSFDTSKAVLAASKITYITMLLKQNNLSLSIEHYNDDLNMMDWEIKNSTYKRFNDYKFSNPQAYFYWHKAISMMK